MAKFSFILALLAYASALLGFAPLWPYLEPLARLLFMLGFAGGVISDKSGRTMPAWLITSLSVLIFCYYAIQVNSNNLVGPAVNLLVVLLSVRLVSGKSPRDLLQIFALSLLTLAAYSLYNVEAIFIVYFIVQYFIVAVALVLLAYTSSGENLQISSAALRKIMTMALLVPLLSLPLLLMFFLILPRTQFPLWNALVGASMATTGYTDKVEPGSSSYVAAAKQVVFRASMHRVSRNELYWRGTVLNSYNGKAWVRGTVPAGEESLPGNGRIIQQIIYPEPGRTNYMFTLNVPRQVIGVRNIPAGDLVFFRRYGPGSGGRYRYDVFSALLAPIEVKAGIDRNYYLDLPGNFSPRMQQLGRVLAAVPGEKEKLERLKELLTDFAIKYATTDLPQGDDPLDEFLFDKKRGHCEFFASATAVLLRMAGIPARLVGGYYGGSYNEYGGYYIVSEDMAHVWVEAYLAGIGWVSVDPTSWAVNYAPVTDQEGKSKIRLLMSALDAASYFWNITVINYDLERQIHIFSQAGGFLRETGWSFRLPKADILFWLLSISALISIWKGRHWLAVTREEFLLMRFRQRLRKIHSEEFDSSVGLHELAERVDAPAVCEFVEEYGKIIYRDRRLTNIEFRRLLRIVNRIGVTKEY